MAGSEEGTEGREGHAITGLWGISGVRSYRATTNPENSENRFVTDIFVSIRRRHPGYVLYVNRSSTRNKQEPGAILSSLRLGLGSRSESSPDIRATRTYLDTPL